MKILSAMKGIALSFLVLVLTSPVYAAQMQTTAKQAILMDAETGAVLYAKNADQRMPTSSMSKVMTAYAVFDAVKRGDISLDDTFIVSEKAWRKGGSKMFVPLKEAVRVEDLLRGVIIQSGNDATIVLAEGVAGSEDAFARILTNKAHELGMSNSNFTNASGWPDENHYSTARDLAVLAQAIIRDFPEYYGYYSEKEFEFNGISQGNRNPLLYRKINADGLKTGHTEDGGYGLIGTGVNHDGRRIIMVLNGMGSKQERADESARMLQYGMNGFSVKTLFENNPNLAEVDVYLGKSSSVTAKAAHKVQVILPKANESDVQARLVYNTPLKAPVRAGDDIGTVVVSVPNQDDITVPLVAAETVEARGIFMALIEKARLLTTGKGRLQ